MPVQKCSKGGKPGFKWGAQGNTCYVYTAGNDAPRRKAKQKAILQGVAIGEEAMSDEMPPAAVSEAIELTDGETFSDFRREMSGQLDAFLPSIGLVPRRWDDELDRRVGHRWWIDDVLDSQVVVYVFGDDIRRVYLRLDWTRGGQVFAFSNPVEVTRRTTYIELDEALRTLPLGASVGAESTLSQDFKLAMAGLEV